MTTFRLFRCNDLLRIGPIHLELTEIERRFLELYMQHMALWPAYCHVADAPGGRITGYILGNTSGVDEDCTGEITVIALPNRDRTDLAERLSNLVVDSCDKIHQCYRVVFHVDCYDNATIKAWEMLGYKQYIRHSNTVELNKPLRVASKPPQNNCDCGACMIIQEESSIIETLRAEGASFAAELDS